MNADTGVSRSATISLHTGTKVPRRARSLNCSNDVMFIARKLREPLQRGFPHDARRWTPPRAPPELILCLGDEHFEAAQRVASHLRCFPEQPGRRPVVDE